MMIVVLMWIEFDIMLAFSISLILTFYFSNLNSENRNIKVTTIILNANKDVKIDIVIPMLTEVSQIGIIAKSVINTQSRSYD